MIQDVFVVSELTEGMPPALERWRLGRNLDPEQHIFGGWGGEAATGRVQKGYLPGEMADFWNFFFSQATNQKIPSRSFSDKYIYEVYPFLETLKPAALQFFAGDQASDVEKRLDPRKKGGWESKADPAMDFCFVKTVQNGSK